MMRAVAVLLIGACLAGVAGADCTPPAAAAFSRPGAGGAATPIRVGLFIFDITHIDAVHQSFTADLFLTLSWHDPRLAEAALGAALAGCPIALSEVWHPEIQVVNRQVLRPQSLERVEVDAEGQVFYRQRFYGQLSARFDLRELPFDEQILRFQVATRFHPREVALMIDEERTGTSEDMSVAGWTMTSLPARTMEYRLESLGRRLAACELAMKAERQSAYFLLKVLMPLSMIVLMAWTVFWIDPTELGPQVGLSTASVLTLIAFQFSLGHMMPRIGYLTRLDRFLLGASILVFFALAEAVATGKLAKGGRVKLARRLDRWARAGYLLVFTVLVAMTFWR